MRGVEIARDESDARGSDERQDFRRLTAERGTGSGGEEPSPGSAQGQDNGPHDELSELRSELTRLEERVSLSESNLHNLVETITDGVLIFGSNGSMVFANRVGKAMLGLPSATVVGRPAEISIVSYSGEDGAAEMRVLGVTWDQEPGSLVLLHDVSSRRTDDNEIAYRATHDALTGLSNRWLLNDRLNQALARGQREQLTIALFYCDLDRLKAVNDRHGHVMGDAVLVETARRLEDVIRPFDTAAHISGDEFVILCENLDESQAESLAGRIVAAFRVPVTVDGLELKMSISVGYVLNSDPGADPVSLLARADKAMFEAKNRRRHENEPPLFV